MAKFLSIGQFKSQYETSTLRILKDETKNTRFGVIDGDRTIRVQQSIDLNSELSILVPEKGDIDKRTGEVITTEQAIAAGPCLVNVVSTMTEEAVL